MTVIAALVVVLGGAAARHVSHMGRAVTSQGAALRVLDTFAGVLDRSHVVPRCAVPSDRLVPVSATDCQRTERGPVQLTTGGSRTAAFSTTGVLAGTGEDGPVRVTIVAHEDSVTTRVTPEGSSTTAREVRVHGRQQGPLLRYFDEHGRELLPTRAGRLAPGSLDAVRLIHVNLSLAVDGSSVPKTTQRWISMGELP